MTLIDKTFLRKMFQHFEGELSASAKRVFWTPGQRYHALDEKEPDAADAFERHALETYDKVRGLSYSRRLALRLARAVRK